MQVVPKQIMSTARRIMSERVRILNRDGIAAFDRYLSELARNALASPPYDILDDWRHAQEFEPEIKVDQMPNGAPFRNRMEFGVYLHRKLSVVDQSAVSRNYGLWNWLSLYFFDQLCPAGADGARRVGPKELYLFLPGQGFRRHIRHLVRSPWLIVADHGDNAKVLLLGTDRGNASPLTTRGRVFEHLAVRQNVLNNRTIIAAARRLYFDERSGRTWFGASGRGAGSVGRYALVVQQLELTYDTRACTVEQLLGLLPSEFDEYKRRAGLR